MEQSGWRYQKDDGRDASGEWLQDGEKWYLFDGQGNMRTGWFQDEAGRWFYFNPGGDMSAGWQWIDEACYYFHPFADSLQGVMYASGLTPDGYLVNESGAWVDAGGTVQRRQAPADTDSMDQLYEEVSYSDGRFESSRSVAADKMAEVDDAVEDFYEEYIQGKISEDEDDWKFKREIEIIRYMVETIRYAEERYRSNSMVEDDYTAYGALIEGEAVCAGYARAFDKLAARCGIESHYVANSTHAWNVVELDDGKWYHVDVTWEDPVGHNDYGYNKLRNKYINLESSQIKKISNHKTWSPDNKKCNAYKYGPTTVAAYLATDQVDDSKAKSYNQIQQEKKDKAEAALNSARVSGGINEFAYNKADLSEELLRYVSGQINWNQAGTTEVKVVISYGDESWVRSSREFNKTLTDTNSQLKRQGDGDKFQISATAASQFADVGGQDYRIVTFKVTLKEKKTGKKIDSGKAEADETKATDETSREEENTKQEKQEKDGNTETVKNEAEEEKKEGSTSKDKEDMELKEGTEGGTLKEKEGTEGGALKEKEDTEGGAPKEKEGTEGGTPKEKADKAGYDSPAPVARMSQAEE